MFSGVSGSSVSSILHLNDAELGRIKNNEGNVTFKSKYGEIDLFGFDQNIVMDKAQESNIFIISEANKNISFLNNDVKFYSLDVQTLGGVKTEVNLTTKSGDLKISYYGSDFILTGDVDFTSNANIDIHGKLDLFFVFFFTCSNSLNENYYNF